MEWPSKNVVHGGVLHPAKAQYSPETHNFIKVLMEESKLTMMQRKKIDYFLRSGDPLPVPNRVFPNPARRRSELSPTRKPPPVSIRPWSSKRRSMKLIVDSGAYEREKFVPKARVDREKEKEKLRNKMAYGTDIVPKNAKKNEHKMKRELEEGGGDFNRFDQLVQEIKEREEWLQKMEELGEGKKHRLVILQQIQARVREMKKLSLGDERSGTKK